MENSYEKTILIGIITNNQNKEKVDEYLDELSFLAETAGAYPVKSFMQKLDRPNPKTFWGRGNLKKLKILLTTMV